jgi:hypothetical protein
VKYEEVYLVLQVGRRAYPPLTFLAVPRAVGPARVFGRLEGMARIGNCAATDRKKAF